MINVIANCHLITPLLCYLVANIQQLPLSQYKDVIILTLGTHAFIIIYISTRTCWCNLLGGIIKDENHHVPPSASTFLFNNIHLIRNSPCGSHIWWLCCERNLKITDEALWSVLVARSKTPLHYILKDHYYLSMKGHTQIHDFMCVWISNIRIDFEIDKTTLTQCMHPCSKVVFYLLKLIK